MKGSCGLGPTLAGDGATERPVMRHLDGGWVLLGSRCPTCEKSFYPPRELCIHDLGRCEDVEFSRRGKIHAAAWVERPPVGFENGFWVAYVDLPEGVRIFAQLLWDADRPPVEGDEVVLDGGQVRDRPPRVGPRFVGPADSDLRPQHQARAGE